MFTEKDLLQLEGKKISQEKIIKQLEVFKKGISPTKLVNPAIPDNGVVCLNEMENYIDKYENSELKITKFVPASGAASRMFKTLFEFVDEVNEDDKIDLKNYPEIKLFFDNIRKFAFYLELNEMLKNYDNIERLINAKKYVLIVKTLLNVEGLAYGFLPKGLLSFHTYAGGIARSSFEEHLLEGIKYGNTSKDNINLHFTVSPEHIEAFNQLKDKVVTRFEDMYNAKFFISFSVQKSSTDTIAVNPDNTPFIQTDGSILFRPGGHGALIENLNDIDSDIIFIKNIDNVVPEKRLNVTIKFKKALGGLLIETQQKVFKILHKLQNSPDDYVISSAKELIAEVFNVSGACSGEDLQGKELIEALIDRLNRPIRVCGVVKNQGESGGGPFITSDRKGCISPQIVETSQIDLKDPEQKNIFESSTHFNPVDLICSVKNFQGKKFDLTKYIDDETCFISHKSKEGKDLKALELPGLWNGAMAGWNTIFVEVPVETFNPVKTINDLLRESHQ